MSKSKPSLVKVSKRENLLFALVIRVESTEDSVNHDAFVALYKKLFGTGLIKSELVKGVRFLKDNGYRAYDLSLIHI